MRPPTAQEGELDERERALRRDAYLAGFIAVAIGAVFAFLVLVAILLLTEWPRATMAVQCGALMTYLLQTFVAVPTLYASWVNPALDEED
jgi:uncharacterized membrane protein YhaH (DUF805 family)